MDYIKKAKTLSKAKNYRTVTKYIEGNKLDFYTYIISESYTFSTYFFKKSVGKWKKSYTSYTSGVGTTTSPWWCLKASKTNEVGRFI